MNILHQAVFWKKFIHNLTVGLVAMILLIGGQNLTTTVLAQACPTPGTPATFSPASGTQFPANQGTVTLTWDPAGGTFFSVIAFSNNMTVFTDTHRLTNSATISVQNGQTYTWSVRPFNSCGSGGEVRATFSVAALTCTSDRLTCPDGTTVGRNPQTGCQFDACPVPVSQCRSIICASLPTGCFFNVAPVTFTCDPNVQLTCGQMVCPVSQPIITPVVPITPVIPAPVVTPITVPVALPVVNPLFGNNQNTFVSVSNVNANSNANSNVANSFASSFASGGGAGSANVTINR